MAQASSGTVANDGAGTITIDDLTTPRLAQAFTSARSARCGGVKSGPKAQKKCQSDYGAKAQLLEHATRSAKRLDERVQAVGYSQTDKNG